MSISRGRDKEKINLWPSKHRVAALSTCASENSWRARPYPTFIFDTRPANCKDQQCRCRTVWWKYERWQLWRLVKQMWKSINQHVKSMGWKKFWVPDRIQTYDLPSTKWALYTLELQGTHGERGHILGSYLICILHTARISKVDFALCSERMRDGKC